VSHRILPAKTERDLHQTGVKEKREYLGAMIRQVTTSQRVRRRVAQKEES